MRTLAITQNITVDGSIEMLGEPPRRDVVGITRPQRLGQRVHRHWRVGAGEQQAE